MEMCTYMYYFRHCVIFRVLKEIRRTQLVLRYGIEFAIRLRKLYWSVETVLKPYSLLSKGGQTDVATNSGRLMHFLH